jgi:transcriptional regulator with XRE-family HTH domain
MKDIPQDQPGPNKLPFLWPSDADPDWVFARRVRVLRDTAKMTQRQLADAMTAAGHRMHQTTIAKIEAGERPVQVGEAVALARVIGVGLDDLIHEPYEEQDQELAQAMADRAGQAQRFSEMRRRVDEAQATLRYLWAEMESSRAALAAATENVEALVRPSARRRDQ